MKKPVIHIGDGPYDGPCTHGSPVLCGKTAGSTHGVMESKTLFWLHGGPELSPDKEAWYSVNLTKAGIRACGMDYREVASESVKMYGYYCIYKRGEEFTLCQECLESEDFGLLALAHV